MRLDPKYFNLFIAVCAIVTVAVILYGTFRYSANQEETFRENIEQRELGGLTFSYIAREDSVRIDFFEGEPVVIDFWATWSGKSRNVHHILQRMKEQYPELTVLAAAVRDSEDLVGEHISRQTYDFIYINGTSFYHEMMVPGVPSQILIDSRGRFFDLQVGEDPESLERKIKALVAHDRI